MELWLYQGTFNPIHNAHLRVAKYILDKYNPKCIIFIPAYNPPHKSIENDNPTDRLEMLKLINNIDKRFVISDIEYKRKGKSYTYLTIKELYETYNDISSVNFIIGTDAFRHIESWYESDKLKDLITFHVFTRDKTFDKSEFDYLKAKGYKFVIEVLDFEDISSTDIRIKSKFRQSLDKLVPKEIEEYIYKNGLYK